MVVWVEWGEIKKIEKREPCQLYSKPDVGNINNVSSIIVETRILNN